MGKTFEEVKAAVESKNERRRNKQLPHDVSVLNWEMIQAHLSELDLGENKRYQLVCQIDQHWLAMDVQIREGKPIFYLVDAAGSFPHFTVLIKLIMDKQAEADIYLTNGGGIIQKSRSGCFTFAIDQAFCLSKIENLQAALDACQTRNSDSLPDYKRLFEETKNRQMTENSSGPLALAEAFDEDFYAKVMARLILVPVTGNRFGEFFWPLLRMAQGVNLWSTELALLCYWQDKEKQKKEKIFSVKNNPDPYQPPEALSYLNHLVNHKTVSFFGGQLVDAAAAGPSGSAANTASVTMPSEHEETLPSPR